MSILNEIHSTPTPKRKSTATWFEDAPMTPEEEEAWWQHIRQESQSQLDLIWDGYGKYAFWGFCGSVFGVGALGGYYQGIKSQGIGAATPNPQSIKLAWKALGLGTLLSVSTIGSITWIGSKLLNINSIAEFQHFMSATVPNLASPLKSAIQESKLAIKIDDNVNVSQNESDNIDHTMKQAFGNTSIWEEFNEEEYKNQSGWIEEFKPDNSPFGLQSTAALSKSL